jgi:hypothetical protein
MSSAPQPHPGQRLITGALAVTGVWTVVAVGAALGPEVLWPVAAAVSVLVFVVGTVLFLWAFGVAVGRSREDVMGIGGLYFLAGSAPRPVQVRLLGCLAVQVAVSTGVALSHPFTALAFCTLVPMFGLGASGLWGARYGTFPPRPDAVS